jgi:ubiquitin-conjugating enzyme E2 J2
MSDLCVRRLKRELAGLMKHPMDGIEAAPLESNLQVWHYAIRGQAGTPYEGGVYHGKLEFPKDYPLKPPAIRLLTPSGRFKEGTKLCFSFSDFHPESWNPMWSVSTILLGFQSFMLDNDSTLGSMDTSNAQRRALAAKSLDFNCKDPVFVELFPHHAEALELQKRERVAAGGQLAASAGDGAGDTGRAARPEPSSFTLVLSVGVSVALFAIMLQLFS